MSRSSIEIEELLTGLIDGQLSDAERLEIEGHLDSDDALQASLGVLQHNRDLLASLPQAASPSFDSRIVALAKERCRQTATPLPHWLVSPQVERAVVTAAPWWKRHAASLAIAAALTFVLASGVVFSFMRNGKDKNDIAKISNPPVQPEIQPTQDQPLVAHPPLLAENTDKPERAIDDTTHAPVVPAQSADHPVKDSIASSNAPRVTVPDAQETVLPDVATNNPEVNNSLASPNVSTDNAGADFALGDIITVVDVTTNKDVEPMERINQLLGRYDIAIADDLNVEQPVVATLEKARLLQGQLAEERLHAGPTTTSLLFVKARAVRIDAMIEDMIADVATFPEISLDAIFETPDIPLLGELRSVQEAKLPQSQKDTVAESVASPLRTSQAGRLFASAQRRQPTIALEDRRGRRTNNSGSLKGEASNPISYVLFVVRSPQ